MASTLTRKQFLAGGVAAAGALASRRGAAAPRYRIRLGLDLTIDHPTTVNATEAGRKIEDATKGEVTLQVFPNSQLGNDTHMLADLRSGAIQMMAIGDNILATLVPSAAIDNLGFAFKSGEVAWNALDGDVGDIVRADIEKAGLHPMRRIWDEGFRQVTSSDKPINAPADLQGFKIRVPPSPISLSLFEGLGASPVTMNVSELYTALQTHVVDGQENPLALIETHKFYQVQKYIAMTSHMWVGYWMLVNGAFWRSLPEQHRKTVEDIFDQQALQQRTDNQKLDDTIEGKLKQQGSVFTTPDRAAFRQKLVASGFYKTWQGKFDPALWSALTKYAGPLA